MKRLLLLAAVFSSSIAQAQVACTKWFNGVTYLGCFSTWKADGTTITCSASGGAVTCSASGGSGGGQHTDATLTGDGSIATPLGINLNNANTWTANQTFPANSIAESVIINLVSDLGARPTGAFSSGQVAFATGASSLSGSNSLYWDNLNLRLGVFTNTPGTTLDIAGVTTLESTVVAGTGDNTTSVTGITFRSPTLAGVNNTIGANVTIASGIGTGNSASSAVVLRAAISGGASGTGQQTIADVIRATYTTTTPTAILGGGEASASPTAPTLRAANSAGSNLTGVALTIQPGMGTGTGTAGNVIFNYGPAGTTGTTQNTATNAVTINGASGLLTALVGETVTGAFTQSGGAVSMHANAASDFTTSSGAETLSGNTGINLQLNGTTIADVGVTTSTDITMASAKNIASASGSSLNLNSAQSAGNTAVILNATTSNFWTTNKTAKFLSFQETGSEKAYIGNNVGLNVNGLIGLFGNANNLYVGTDNGTRFPVIVFSNNSQAINFAPDFRASSTSYQMSTTAFTPPSNATQNIGASASIFANIWAKNFGTGDTNAAAQTFAYEQYGGQFQVQPSVVPGAISLSGAGSTGGATTWCYALLGRYTGTNTSTGLISGIVCTTTGQATLSGGAPITVTLPANATGAFAFDLYRTTAGGTPSTVGKIGTNVSTTFNDTGIAGDSVVITTTRITGADSNIQGKLVLGNSAGLGGTTTVQDNPLSSTAVSVTTPASGTNNFPAFGGMITIDSELLYCYGTSGGNSFTSCYRAMGGTSAASHTQNTTIYGWDILLGHSDTTIDFGVRADGNVGVGTLIPTSTLTVAGSIAGKYNAQSGTTYTTQATDHDVVMTNSGARTVTLITAVSVAAGTHQYVIDGNNNAGTNNVSVARSGSDTINGGTGNVAVVTANSAHSTCISDGVSKWICGVNN